MKPKQFAKLLPLFLSGILFFAAGCNDGKEPAAEVPPPRYDFELDKPELELAVGDSELVSLLPDETVAGDDVVWTSDNESVATVTAGGVIAGKGVGETYVRATHADMESGVLVHVVENKSFDENILITVFWPPTAEYMNGGEGDERWDEQFKLLADAGIDHLCNVTGRDRQQNNPNPSVILENSKETNLKMAKYAYKYGMSVTVADPRFGDALLSTSDEDIFALISEYRNIPGVRGYFLKDEPVDPMTFTRVYEAVKQADPNGYAHLNLLPYTWYYAPNPGGLPHDQAILRYQEIARNWLQANEDTGYPQDYLMFDLYPFGPNYDLNRADFFTNLNAVREVGLEKDVKTALYLQSCRGILQATGQVGYCRPKPEQIRYEAMVALAFGYKQLSYFTWFQPTNRNGEWFEDSIVLEDGTPNEETYEPISVLNAEIHNLGKTLIRLDAKEVYMNGEQYGGVGAIPNGFLFTPSDDAKYTVSLMKHKDTGRNYLMLVNNDYSDPIEITGKIGVSSVQLVDPSDGGLTDFPLEGDRLVVQLDAGDGILFALPEGQDFLG